MEWVLWGIPGPLWLTFLTAAAGLGGWFGRHMLAAVKGETAQETDLVKLGWAEVRERDEQIELLRRALDRSRRRENGYATAFEIVLLAAKLKGEDQTLALARAREILEVALTLDGRR